jgi:hypothetical protein
MIPFSYDVVVEKNLESIVVMKDLFNERIPKIPMNDIDTMMKNSIQFICQQDTTICGGVIVKEDNNWLCLVLIAIKKQERRIGEKLLSSIFNHYDKSSMEIYVHADRRSRGFYLISWVFLNQIINYFHNEVARTTFIIVKKTTTFLKLQ